MIEKRHGKNIMVLMRMNHIEQINVNAGKMEV